MGTVEFLEVGEVCKAVYGPISGSIPIIERTFHSFCNIQSSLEFDSKL